MKFSTILHQIGNNTGIVIPIEILDALGTSRKPPVTVSFKDYTYRTTVGSMGGKYMVPVSAAIRAATGVKGGDPLDVEIDNDSAPREVALPADFAAALAAEPSAKAAYDRLAPSRKKAHVTVIEEAKTPETRQRRIDKAIAELKA